MSKGYFEERDPRTDKALMHQQAARQERIKTISNVEIKKAGNEDVTVEKIIHGKRLKTSPKGILIDDRLWDEKSLRDAHYSWKFRTDEEALEIFGVNKSQLNVVFMTAIKMIKNK